MSINKADYKRSVESIARAMHVLANGDAASVQINDGGTCILRQGPSQTEYLTVDQFAERLDEIMERHYEKGGV